MGVEFGMQMVGSSGQDVFYLKALEHEDHAAELRVS